MFPTKFCYDKPNLELIICWFQMLILTFGKQQNQTAWLRKTEMKYCKVLHLYTNIRQIWPLLMQWNRYRKPYHLPHHFFNTRDTWINSPATVNKHSLVHLFLCFYTNDALNRNSPPRGQADLQAVNKTNKPHNRQPTSLHEGGLGNEWN